MRGVLLTLALVLTSTLALARSHFLPTLRSLRERRVTAKSAPPAVAGE